MPVMLDVNKEETVKKRDLSKGVPLILSPEDKGQIVLSKYISNDPLHADFQPAGEWWEQVVVDTGRAGAPARILVAGEDGEPHGVDIDDGLIIDIIGTLTGLYGVVPGLPPMTEEQVADYQITNETRVPMFQRWDFRIKRVLKTDGPAARIALTRSEDQKRQAAQADMYEAFAQMFKLGAAQMQAQGNLSPTAQEAVNAALAKGTVKEK